MTLAFNGSNYVPARDAARLSNQYDRVFGLMSDGDWRTLAEISEATHAPPASVSAQLRHMRKARFGGHKVLKKYLGRGLYRYKVETR